MGKGFLQDLIISFQENLVYVIGAALAVLFILLLTFTPTLFTGNGSLTSASVDPRSGSMPNDSVGRPLGIPSGRGAHCRGRRAWWRDRVARSALGTAAPRAWWRAPVG